MKRLSVQRMARLGLLLALSLILGYLEHLVPLTPLPGIKLGLSNAVLLYAIYLMGSGASLMLMLGKVLLSGLLFGGMSAMLYSLAGGICSFVIMLFLHKHKLLDIIGISVAGAVMHNLGQLALASLIVGSHAALSYLPLLMLSGIIAGIATGVAAKYTIRALEKAT